MSDEIEHLATPFYIRWTSGPDYEDAYLCFEDGEPDMWDFAKVSFKEARTFKEAVNVLVTRARRDALADAAKVADSYANHGRDHTGAKIAAAIGKLREG